MKVNNPGRKPAVSERKHGVLHKGQQHKSDLLQHAANPEHAAHCRCTNDAIWNTDMSQLHRAHAQTMVVSTCGYKKAPVRL